MPFTTTNANSILNWLFGKGELTRHTDTYIGLTTNNPEESGSILELPADGGYSRVVVTRYIQTKDNGVLIYPNLMGTANNREIKNTGQINWTKADTDWPRVNGFFLSTSPTVGETSSIFFYGALELTEEQKAAGGLLVEKGAVALFDPESFKIKFPAEDVEATDGKVLFASQVLGEFVANEETFGRHYKSVAPCPFTLTAGKTYTVVWDDEKYTCVAQDSSSVMEGTAFIGNGSDFGFANNGEPFAIVCSSVDVAFFAIGSTDSTHSCIVYQVD